MLNFKQFPYKIILASQSPRRQSLLKGLGLDFEIKVKNGIEEIYPETLQREEIAVFLAETKANAYTSELKDSELLVTADTIVWLSGEVLGKPEDVNDAKNILRKLSGKSHYVITGVCLKTTAKEISFHSETEVHFKSLTEEEIEYYIQNFKPMDKAGAYGIQEWIGYIGVESINGSYFNVMGLPIQRLYDELIKFTE